MKKTNRHTNQRNLVRSILYISSLMGVCMLSGCKKWLDATPQDKVPQTVLFSTEQGFKDALTGVYLGMDKPANGSSGIYTSDLSMGILSVMGYDYDNAATANVSIGGVSSTQVFSYNYNDASFKAEIAAVWNTLYTNIANLNNILTQADGARNVFSGDAYQRIKGESLALRALFHFDLVRLFGQPPLVAGSTLSIPYVTKFGINQTPLYAVGNVLDSCIRDLRDAKNLLAQTDTSAIYGATTNAFTSYTQNHLNYWAAKGLLSKVFLYRGNTDSAAYYATDVIGSGKFPLITSNVAYSGNAIQDRTFSQEHLFALYSQATVGITENTLFNVSTTAITPLVLSPAGRTARYGTPAADNTDWRLKSWFDVPASGNANLVPSKFIQNANLPYALQGLMPVLRMAEMYYIASECAGARGNISTGVGYINAVRAARGLQALNPAGINTVDSLTHLISNEYRKEFIQEGQTFFYCKRLNLNLNQALGTAAVLPPAPYVWPLPDAEKLYRGL